MTKIFDIARTKKDLEELAADNQTFLREYVIDRDEHYSSMDNETLKKPEVILAIKQWSKQKEEARRTGNTVKALVDLMPLILGFLELAAGAPVTGNKDQDETVIKVIRIAAMTVVKEIMASPI
jgi:hypothetical protein